MEPRFRKKKQEAEQVQYPGVKSKCFELTRSRLFAEWAEQTILVIGTHFAAPTAGHIVRDGAVFRFLV